MIAIAVVRTTCLRLPKLNVERKPTMPASIIAGPDVPAGGMANIITARKTKVSARDFLLSLCPSLLVTETVKRLAAKISNNRANHDRRPSSPPKRLRSSISAQKQGRRRHYGPMKTAPLSNSICIRCVVLRRSGTALLIRSKSIAGTIVRGIVGNH